LYLKDSVLAVTGSRQFSPPSSCSSSGSSRSDPTNSKEKISSYLQKIFIL